ncbi:carotenoid oxygenase family protein [Nocardia cyriacigeorgica]|uniref:carotenoid oxygenase family protein n=1 Tax=Nocardia cyriacigeorgica TaxID=135487 RepID=UPI0013D04EFB|nr:carotenoid oxygenase family protein [Nocardia cyriacigeorgica]NEW25451.1 dioxygenase [Nocardia cyriacigeorgica]
MPPTRPAWLTGHLAPVPDEIDALDLEVTGTLPDELTGRYFRNGPNPAPGQPNGHWFAGAGMIHGVRLRGGHAEWYRNRWVRTTAFTDRAPFIREDATIDRAAVSANTHVIPHGDRIFALVEAGFPYEVTPELQTVGPCDFGGRLDTAMTAHPKLDPSTGDLLFFGYGFQPPYLTYHRLSAAGQLVESREVEVRGPTMMHDFAITENYVIWLDLPVTFDHEMAIGGVTMPYRWDDEYGARLGVMPRGAGPVQWFDIEPCYIFHIGNAYERDGAIVIDGARYRPEDFAAVWTTIGGISSASADTPAAGARLHRWTLHPATGVVSEDSLDDRAIEFPTHDLAVTGRGYRYLYTVSSGAIVKYDLDTGRAIMRRAEHPGEAVFVPAEGRRAEDEGWLLSLVGAELVILDAHELSQVGSVRLPRRVPAGFHGSWVPDPD